MTKKAVVLLSGGIDSSVTAAIAKAEGYEIYALSFDYSQRHRLELESAKKVAESLKAKTHLIIKFDLREIGGSSLTADIEVPKDRAEMQKSALLQVHDDTVIHGDTVMVSLPNYNELSNFRASELPSFSAIPITYVPARNTIFLSFALGWAEVLEAPDIFIGANAVDYSGYPDCRPEYLKAFEEMANLATKASVEGRIRFKINAPLLYMTKGEIIKKGSGLGFDYSLTWSCYDPKSVEHGAWSVNRTTHNGKSLMLFVPCGRCDSCIFRAKGFKEAGIKDPLTEDRSPA